MEQDFSSVTQTVGTPRPKFSVIIGIYNQAGFIPNLIDSLNRQTFKDFEVIFCDDGSSDNPKAQIESCETNFYYKFVTQKNRGMRLAKNINNGIKRAIGEYCVFIMADSFPESNYLEVLKDYADGESVVCGIRVHVEKGRVVEMDYRLRKSMIPKHPVLLSEEPHKYITGNGLAVPTEAFREYGGWCEEIKGYGGDDTELIARLYYRGYLMYSVPQMILYHNYHPNKETVDKNQRIVNKLIKQHAGH